jgi:CRP/FNR family transcriptional regulator, cyclic AMP receptor protein
MATRRRPRFDPKAFLAEAGEGRTISQYRKDQIVFSQGDPADAVFYIQKGKVKVGVVSDQGKEAVVAILGAEEFCGEGCLAGQPRRIATVRAMTECTIMRLQKTSIIRALYDEPAFSELFMSHLLARAIRVEEDLVDQLFNSSEKRLARLLLLLANFGKEGRPEPLIAKISQETLAEMIGTTRSRVSFFMNKFRRLGFSRLQRRRPGSSQLAVERDFARLAGASTLCRTGSLDTRPGRSPMSRAQPVTCCMNLRSDTARTLKTGHRRDLSASGVVLTIHLDKHVAIDIT